jgi:SNF2 family DNA or RNA helicase
VRGDLGLMVFAELDKSGRRILLEMGYDPAAARLVKQIPGWSWRKGDKIFAVPANMTTGRNLRKLLGAQLQLGPNLEAWAREQRKRERNLSSFSIAEDAELSSMRVATELPLLAQTLWAHQRADAVFMSKTSCINANEQGTGKTRDVLAAVYEAGLEEQPQLVIAPVTSIESTWANELKQYITVPVLASEKPADRVNYITEAARLAAAGEPFWLIINKEMVRYIASYEEEYDENRGVYKKVRTGIEEAYPELFEISWGSVTIDEFHKAGLSNPKTLGAMAFSNLKCERLWPMSGTPMRGKPTNLWGALHLLDPKNFRSQNQWEDNWLEVGKDYMDHRVVGGIREGMEDEFYSHLAPYMVRRLKSEVFPELPPKEYEDVWCTMTPGQAKQYNVFAEEAEIRIDEHHLTATNVLAEYARLKIFATAMCNVEGRDVYDYRTREWVQKFRLKATIESGKFPRLLAKLQECGVEPYEDQLGALVGSQDVSVVIACATYLRAASYRVAVVYGDMKKADGSVREIVAHFQEAGPTAPQVLVMTVAKGGTSITADRADSVHILDESWVPDEQEQFEDRAHRGSRMHRVRVFYYRTKGTIEEYIHEVTTKKAWTNFDVLDFRRQGYRARS